MLVWKVLWHRYSKWDYKSNRLIFQWFNQICLPMVSNSPTGSFPFLLTLISPFIAQLSIFCSLMEVNWYSVLMCFHLMPRNLGHFFMYLSAFLVSLSVKCSFLFAHFATGISCVFVLKICSYIPRQLQITLSKALKFVYLGVSFPKQNFFYFNV